MIEGALNARSEYVSGTHEYRVFLLSRLLVFSVSFFFFFLQFAINVVSLLKVHCVSFVR